MARIVLGLGTSHSPQVSAPAELWPGFTGPDGKRTSLLGRDGEFHDYAEVEQEAGTRYAGELTPEVWLEKHGRAQKAVAVLHDTFLAAAPDAAVIIGDDQTEWFGDDARPTFAVFRGAKVTDLPRSPAKLAALSEPMRAAQWATHGEAHEDYPALPKLGEHLVRELAADEFDVTQIQAQPPGRSLGHAFTFVRRRIMGERLVPVVPILVNTYYPPNQPSARRCLNFGRSLRRAIQSWDGVGSVAVIASGGLSHIVVDEALDRRVIAAMSAPDPVGLAELPRRLLRAGTSEILNWVVAAGALEHLRMELIDYIPAYRSPAGTGVGMTFSRWQ